MEPPVETCRRWDIVGTVLSLLVLVGGTLIALFGCKMLAETREMVGAMGDVQLPLVSEIAWRLQQAQIPATFSLSLLFLGVFMLVKIPDRPRANLYAGLTGLLLGLTGGGLTAVSILPMLKMVSTMGSSI
jgi:hypothetical protein